MIDADCFPHIIDNILSLAINAPDEPISCFLHLRLVSKSWRDWLDDRVLDGMTFNFDISNGWNVDTKRYGRLYSTSGGSYFTPRGATIDSKAASVQFGRVGVLRVCDFVKWDEFGLPWSIFRLPLSVKRIGAHFTMVPYSSFWLSSTLSPPNEDVADVVYIQKGPWVPNRPSPRVQ